MSTQSDEILFELIRQNDQRALEQLFERHYYNLCDFAFSYLKCFDLTEEVVSDVFMNIWRRRHQLTISGSLKAYLFVSTRNQALNYLQKEKQLRNLVPLEEDRLPANDFHPEKELQYRELEHAIDALLETLPSRRKQVFKLSRIEGFTYKEIAGILSISVYTVQNQMVKAVKQLALLSRKVRNEE